MYLNIDNELLHQHQAYETAREIVQQPSTWIKTFNLIKADQTHIETFLDHIGPIGSFDVIFMGAGTSEYIGNTLVPLINPLTGFSARSVPSTDMIIAPRDFINPVRKTLFVSFARSGKSPESVGSVNAVEAVCTQAYHLFITCNKEGELAKRATTMKNVHLILLPDETNDLGFAMTSSFSNMLLAAVLVFNLKNLDLYENELPAFCEGAKDKIDTNTKILKELIESFDFERIVYLGSLAMKGIAQESVLKVNELTAGKIATQFDTFLGFRHGPKSFINPRTLIVAYLSDDEFIRRYELDLIKELQRQRKGNKIIVVYHKPTEPLGDVMMDVGYQKDQPMIYVGLKMLMVAHCLAFLKSYSFGITTDNPCPTGEVNRVVTGVTIYPIEGK